eukprot:1919764-Heterocapsa_arctica.AAC.1
MSGRLGCHTDDTVVPFDERSNSYYRPVSVKSEKCGSLDSRSSTYVNFSGRSGADTSISRAVGVALCTAL